MARTKNALFSVSAQGKVGDLVVEQRREGQYIKLDVKAKNRKTIKQVERQNRYGEGVEGWHGLSTEEKAAYNAAATDERISGFNLYVREIIAIPLVAICGIAICGYNKCGKPWW